MRFVQFTMISITIKNICLQQAGVLFHILCDLGPDRKDIFHYYMQ